MIRIATSGTDNGLKGWGSCFLKDMGYRFDSNDLPGSLGEFQAKLGCCGRCGVEKESHQSTRYCADGVLKAWFQAIAFDVKNSIVFDKGCIRLQVYESSKDEEKQRLICIHITSLCQKINPKVSAASKINPKVSAASKSNTLEYVPILLADQTRRFYLKPEIKEGMVGWKAVKIDVKVNTKKERSEWMESISPCLKTMREVLARSK
jgi:hypothetical protein